MNRTRVHPRNIRRSVLASAIACCFAPGWALANPVGPSVAHGQASFSSQGKLLTVTNSPGAIINWQAFSISAGEITRFQQQNAASAVLNRVTGKSASEIFGALQSNGRVFLINPNGVVFGAGAQIDTAGLVASTLNMMDGDFIMGRMRFGETPGAKSIRNEGEIRTPAGGRVLLIAPEGVENSGIIRAPKGEVILAAGKTVELADSANPEVRVEVSAPEAKALNLGKIVSESGRIGIYGGIVANRGVVSADSAVVGADGKIAFKATKDTRADGGDTRSGTAVLNDNGRMVFTTGARGSSEAGSMSAVPGDNGRVVFKSTSETAPAGASAIVADNGRVVFQKSAPTLTPETANLTSTLSENTVAGGGGSIVLQATTEANLDAGSTTSASGPSGGSIVVSSGNGTTLVAGDVRATGSHGVGGEVRLLGARVGMIGTGSIDVSGERGGGTALVGGDTHGANPAVPNALMTYFGPDASIRADAGASGNGGKVIVWADDSTRSYGTISARGGSGGGDGGFVETSGQRALDVRRGPDLRAPAGKPGTWLLDPNNLSVVAGSALDPLLNTGAPFFAPLGDSSTIGVDLINAQLDFGSNVTLNTTSRGATAGTEAGNITILAPIVKRAKSGGGVFIGTTNLTLQAHNDIVIGAGGSVTSTGDPLSVTLQANFDGAGGGGVTIGGPVTTKGGGFFASGRDAIAVNAPINTGSGSVQITSTGSNVILAAPITGGFLSAAAQGGTLTLASSIASDSSVTLTGRDGVSIAAGAAVSTGPFAGFSASVTGTGGGAIDVAAGATISARGATLTADTMNIQGVVNAGDGSMTVRQTSAGRAINIGSESGSALSLTQSELDHLITTSTFSLGSSSSGPITVSGAVSGLSSSFLSVTSGTSFTQNAAVSLTGGVSINAPAITIAAPLSSGASGITFTADTLTVSSPVTSGGSIDVTARTFGRQISLGVSAPSGSALEMTDAQIDLLSTPTRLRFSTSGPIVIAGPVGPAGTSTLSLASSNSSVTQASLATITVPNLAVSARTSIDLPEHNDVSTFAAQIQCCSAGSINFVAAAGKAVTIGTVDGISGVTVNNFSGSGAIALQADALDITQSVSVVSGDVKIMPETVTRTTTLGAEVGGTLSLTAAELARVQGTRVIVNSDEIDIAGAINLPAATTVLGPLTADRPVKIVGAKSDPTALEFTPGELANITGGTVEIGGANAGPVSVLTSTAVPNSISKLVLHSGGTSSTVTVGLSTPLTATNSLGIIADTVDLQSGVSSSAGNIEVSTHTASRKIDIGIDPGPSLGLGTAEIGFLSAPSGTLSFTTAGGDIDVTGVVSFPNVNTVSFDAGGTFRLLSAGSLASGGAVSIRAPALDIQGMTSLSTAAGGALSLIGNTMAINASATTITSAGDINIRPRDFRSINLGGADTGFSLGLDNTELGAMTPAGILRIGESSLGLTGDITISAAISLPGRTVSLKTGDGRIAQSAGATLSASALAAEALDDISLNELNQVNTIAMRTGFGPISFVRDTGSALTVGSVDDLTGIQAGIFSSAMPVSLRADQINIDQGIFGSTVTLLPTSGTSIDIGTRSGFGFDQTDLDRITATSVTIGNALSDDITVSTPINVTTFTNLALVSGANAAVSSDITLPGDLSITASSMNVTAPLTSTGGNIALVTDSLDVGSTVSAFKTITARPVTGTVQMDLGTETVGKLSLDAAEVANLVAPSLVFGATPQIDISTGIVPNAAVQSISLITNDLTVPGSLTVPNLSISTVTAGRTIDLGTSATGTFMGLDAATLGRLNVSDTLSFSAPGASTITVSSSPLGIVANDLSLSAGTINVNQSLSMPGDIELRADSPLNIAAGKTVSSTGGGDITVAPRAGSMTYGAGGLLDSTRLAQLSTSGFVELGDSNTTALSIAQPLNGSTFGGLMLTATGNISQTAGSIITASKLGVMSSFGAVTLTESNAVGTLAGSAGSFTGINFSNAAPLTIGSVHGLTGLASGGLVTLRTDNIDVAEFISGTTVTLAPKAGGTPIDLGTDTGYGLTNAEINRVFASTLNVGAGVSGPITVSAPVDYRSGSSLILQTAPGSSIAVNAALGSASSATLSLNTGAGGSVNVAGPIASAGNIGITADTIATSNTISTEFGFVQLLNSGTSGSVTIGGAVDAGSGISVVGKTIAVNAPLTAEFGSVSLTAPTGAAGSSTTINGAVEAGGNISITTDSLAINAPLESGFAVTLAPRTSGTPVSVGLETPGAFSVTTSELGLIDADRLTLGSSSAGDLTINAAIGPFAYDTLDLRSGGDVTQTPGSTITVRKGDSSDPSSLSGALSVTAGGKIELPEANDIAVSVSGSASGTAKDFIFNNVSPLRLQNVSGVFASGKVIIKSATGSGFSTPTDLVPDVVRELANIEKSEPFKGNEDKKDEADKKEREEDKKQGRQSCS